MFNKMELMKKYKKFSTKYILKVTLLGVFTFISVNNICNSQIKGEKLVLKRSQEPEVKRIEKKKTSAYHKKPIRPKEEIEYKITNLPLLSDYKPSEIEAKDISPEFNVDYKRRYFQVGYGNYSKFLADGNISEKISESVELGVDLHHISTSGLKDVYEWDSRHQNSDASIFMNAYRESGKVNISADFDYSDYNYYGNYQKILKPEKTSHLDQYFAKVGIKGYYQSYQSDLLEDIRINTYLLRDNFKAREDFIDMKVNFHASENEKMENVALHLGAGIKSLESEFKIESENITSQYIVNVNPEITTFFSGKRDYLKFGLNFMASNVRSRGIARDVNKLHWFPTIKLLIAPEDEVKFYAGFDGNVTINTYSNVLKENPYVISDLKLQPTVTKNRVYFGVKGDIGQKIRYDINAGYSKIENALFYKANGVFQTSISNRRPVRYDYLNTFGIIYDSGNLGEVSLLGVYSPINDLEITGNILYQRYSLKKISNPQYKPVMKADFGVDYYVFDRKLNLNLNAIVTSRMYTNMYRLTVNGDEYEEKELKDEKIPDNIDLNAYAEYKFHKNMSIFIMGNNLTGNLCCKYIGYRVLSRQVLGGLKLEF